jgi:hypothetical protein
MTEEVEREVVDLLRTKSQLTLLGSHYGRKDHRVFPVSGEGNRGGAFFISFFFFFFFLIVCHQLLGTG